MRPTNLLFVLSDEHNRDTLGCYGHPLVQTPNLDVLARRGVRFDAAYTNCPICVPARASLATGQYVHQIGYWDNAFPYDGRVPAWGHRLIANGYRVDSIGKLHYRSAEDDDGFSQKINPLNVVEGVGDLVSLLRDEMPSPKGAREVIIEAGPGTSTYLEYDRDIAQRARQWLSDRALEPKLEKPWVLFVSFVSPHPPFVAPLQFYERYPLDQIALPIQNRPKEQPQHPALVWLREMMFFAEPFSDEEIRRATAAYYGTCTHLDQQIGLVLDTLEETGLSRNTRVIYTSDHGESMGRRGMWGKFSMYEESAAVPFLVAGPDIPQGRVCTDLISLVDCYPTILEATGLELTEMDRQLPGESIWPMACAQSRTRTAFSEYHAAGSKSAIFMLRDGRFKYIHYVDYRPQLFDLERDPQELTDLADQAEYKQIRRHLERQLRILLDPVEVDKRAKADQRALVDRHGGRGKILKRGAFINSPVPGEKPVFYPE